MARQIKLYGTWLSAPVLKVGVTLEEMEIDYEFISFNLREGNQKQADFLAKNPWGKVPLLEDGDLNIYESAAIMRYIADKYSGNGHTLYGKNLVERAYVDQWLEVAAHNFSGPAGGLLMQTVFRFKEDAEAFKKSLSELATVLDVYEERLKSSRYLAGGFFSLAELAHIPALNYLVGECPEVLELINSRSHVKAWWQDISARPAWQKVAQECSKSLKELRAWKKA